MVQSFGRLFLHFFFPAYFLSSLELVCIASVLPSKHPFPEQASFSTSCHIVVDWCGFEAFPWLSPGSARWARRRRAKLRLCVVAPPAKGQISWGGCTLAFPVKDLGRGGLLLSPDPTHCNEMSS
jgi:hypothetical protein